jgi:hypothetical protein
LVRFWDGQAWTDQAAPGPPTGGIPVRGHTETQGSSVGIVFFVAIGLVLVAAIIGVLVYSGRHDGRGDQAGAVSACRNFVLGRLQDPSGAQFGYVSAIGPIGERWTVSGMVQSGDIFSGTRTSSFTCTVEPTAQDGYWHLVSMRFS